MSVCGNSFYDLAFHHSLSLFVKQTTPAKWFLHTLCCLFLMRYLNSCCLNKDFPYSFFWEVELVRLVHKRRRGWWTAVHQKRATQQLFIQHNKQNMSKQSVCDVWLWAKKLQCACFIWECWQIVVVCFSFVGVL